MKVFNNELHLVTCNPTATPFMLTFKLSGSSWVSTSYDAAITDDCLGVNLEQIGDDFLPRSGYEAFTIFNYL